MSLGEVAVSDIADKLDAMKAKREGTLAHWVERNPQWWAIVIAGTTQTGMDLEAGLWDVLRFGEGAAQGGVRGWGKDALRLLAIVGPLARGGALAARGATQLLIGSRLRLAVQLRGVTGPCTFQAANNAAQIATGSNVFVTLGDMAAAMGQPLKAIARNSTGLYELGAWVDELIPVIRKVATVKEIRGLSSLQEIMALAKQGTGVVIFAIRATVRTGAGAVTELRHSVIAVRNLAGRVQFADYGGKLVGSLEELVAKLNYGHPVAIELLQSKLSAAVVSAKYIGETAMKLAQGAVLVIEGLTAIETKQNGVEFARPVEVGAIHTPSVLGPVPHELLKASLAAYTARQAGRPVIRLPETVIRPASAIAPSSHRLDGIQFRLNALGYCAGWEDNVMGPHTQRAIRHFQRDHPPLVPDGDPGPKTRERLVDVCGF